MRKPTVATIALMISCHSSGPQIHQPSPFLRLPPVGFTADISNVGPVDIFEVLGFDGENGSWDDRDDVAAGNRLVWFSSLNSPGSTIGPPIASEPMYGGNMAVDFNYWQKITFRLPAQQGPAQLLGGLSNSGDLYPGNSSARSSGTEWLYDAQGRFVFTRASCPHPAMFWTSPFLEGGLYIKTLEFGFSEDLDPASINSTSVAVSYGGQAVLPASVTLQKRSNYDGATQDVLVIELPAVMRGDGNGLSGQVTIRNVKGATGVPMAGNFFQDMSCNPSDFVFASGPNGFGVGRAAGTISGEMLTRPPTGR